MTGNQILWGGGKKGKGGKMGIKLGVSSFWR